MVTVSTGDDVITVPDDASDAVKRAIETLKNRMAKDAERKAQDIWGGDENKRATEADIASLIGDIFEAHSIEPKATAHAYVEIKFTDGKVSSCELFTKVTRIRAGGGRRSKSGNGFGRKSIRDLVRERYNSEVKSFTMGDNEYTRPSQVLDALAVPYYKPSEPNPTGDAPQRTIVKFGRENPEAAANIIVNLEDGSEHTLADLIKGAQK